MIKNNGKRENFECIFWEWVNMDLVETVKLEAGHHVVIQFASGRKVEHTFPDDEQALHTIDKILELKDKK